jgi:hypothetical protein
VNHLGVCQDCVAAVTDPCALLVWGVTVVRCGLDLVNTQRAKGPKLILRQRLGREQQQRCGPTVALGRSLGDGDLITERLTRRRAGRHRNRLAISQMVDGLGLMGEELIKGQRFDNIVGQRAIQCAKACRARSEAFDVHNPAVFFEPCQQLIEAVRAHHLHLYNSRDGVGQSRVLHPRYEESGLVLRGKSTRTQLCAARCARIRTSLTACDRAHL